MGDSDRGEPEPENPTRRALLIGVPVAVLLVAALVIGLVVFGGGDPEESAADPTEQGEDPGDPSSTTSTAPPETDPGSSGTSETTQAPSEDGDTPEATVVESETGLRLAELTVVFPPDGEVAVCTEAQRRLGVYREIAAESDPADLTELRLSMDEFEANLYTAAENHDWGDRMIEHLTGTRRLWATAASAGVADDAAAADRAAADALVELDAAIAVECP